jgi:hypothetical protein
VAARTDGLIRLSGKAVTRKRRKFHNGNFLNGTLDVIYWGMDIGEAGI